MHYVSSVAVHFMTSQLLSDFHKQDNMSVTVKSFVWWGKVVHYCFSHSICLIMRYYSVPLRLTLLL